MKVLRGFLIAGVLAGVLAMTGAQAADAPKVGTKDIVLKGDAKCTECHDEADAPDILRIGKTRHGTVADSRTPTCTSCHGESSSHLGYKGSDKPPKPDRIFGKNAVTSPAQRSEACLTCHQGSKRHLWAGSAHETRGVACTNCHRVHAAKDPVRNKLTQPDVCYTCHKEQRAQVARPSHHPVNEGKVACSDCHNAHGSAGPKLLVKDSVNETCYECHMEKRGPFVHNHQPVTEDCSICHNAHGTTAATLLKQRVPLLCQNCHNALTGAGAAAHRSQFISRLPSRAAFDKETAGSMGAGCLNCHVNIHGSNSSSGSSSGGRFRN